MPLKRSGLNAAILLSMGAALIGCSSIEQGFASTTGALSSSYGRFGPSWGGMGPALPTDSLTVQRIRNMPAVEALPTLQPEPGDVWPQEEGRRATLANPEEALRGIQPTEQPSRPRRGSAAAFDSQPGIAGPVVSPIFEGPAPPQRANRADAPRPERGQVFHSDQGAVTTTGGSGRVRSTISPDGSGLAIQDGGTTTLIGPDGSVRQVPTPR